MYFEPIGLFRERMKEVVRNEFTRMILYRTRLRWNSGQSVHSTGTIQANQSNSSHLLIDWDLQCKSMYSLCKRPRFEQLKFELKLEIMLNKKWKFNKFNEKCLNGQIVWLLVIFLNHTLKVEFSLYDVNNTNKLAFFIGIKGTIELWYLWRSSFEIVRDTNELCGVLLVA